MSFNIRLLFNISLCNQSIVFSHIFNAWVAKRKDIMINFFFLSCRKSWLADGAQRIQWAQNSPNWIIREKNRPFTVLKIKKIKYLVVCWEVRVGGLDIWNVRRSKLYSKKCLSVGNTLHSCVCSSYRECKKLTWWLMYYLFLQIHHVSRSLARWSAVISKMMTIKTPQFQDLLTQ